MNTGNEHTCQMFNGIPISMKSGYLAAVSSMESHVGTADCPWLLDIYPGQVVNFTFDGALVTEDFAGCPLKLFLIVYNTRRIRRLSVCFSSFITTTRLETLKYLLQSCCPNC